LLSRESNIFNATILKNKRLVCDCYRRKFNGLFTICMGHINLFPGVRVTSNNVPQRVACEFCSHTVYAFVRLNFSGLSSWRYRPVLSSLVCVSGLQNNTEYKSGQLEEEVVDT
jgi:hypothetical protein